MAEQKTTTKPPTEAPWPVSIAPELLERLEQCAAKRKAGKRKPWRMDAIVSECIEAGLANDALWGKLEKLPAGAALAGHRPLFG